MMAKEEYAVIYVTKGLMAKVRGSTHLWVVVDKETGKILDASNKSLVGKTWPIGS